MGLYFLFPFLFSNDKNVIRFVGSSFRRMRDLFSEILLTDPQLISYREC